MAKLANRVCVYGVEGEPPLLFDLDGRGNDIFPTGEIPEQKDETLVI